MTDTLPIVERLRVVSDLPRPDLIDMADAIEMLVEALELVAQHGRIDDSEHRMNVVGEALSRVRAMR